MVEADKLPPSILDIYKVFEHIDIIDMLSIVIQQQPSYSVTIPILVGSDFGFWVICGVKMMSTCRGLAFSLLLPMHLASHLKRRTSSSALA